MASVLHLLKPGDPTLALAVIERDLQAGHTVAVALLPGAQAPALPPGARVHRVTEDVSWAQLLDLVFASDTVITW
jgi:hypothetical protein